MCYTHDEAKAVYKLQPLIAGIDMSKSALEISRIIASSTQVQQTLQQVEKFYPVAYGINESAVHRDWSVTLSNLTVHSVPDRNEKV